MTRAERDVNEEMNRAGPGMPWGSRIQDFRTTGRRSGAGAQAGDHDRGADATGTLSEHDSGKEEPDLVFEGISDPLYGRRIATGRIQDFSKPLQAMEALLAQARVAVYPVDAGGLMNLQDTNIANVTAPTEKGLVADLQAAKGEAARERHYDSTAMGERAGHDEGPGDGDGGRGLHQYE